MRVCKEDGCDNAIVYKSTGRNSPQRTGQSCKTCNTLKSSYGITTPERAAMLAEQDGNCAICGITVEFRKVFKGSKASAAVDHCHTTGEVRGILCSDCNLSLGLIKDSQDTLFNMIKYLRRS